MCDHASTHPEVEARHSLRTSKNTQTRCSSLSHLISNNWNFQLRFDIILSTSFRTFESQWINPVVPSANRSARNCKNFDPKIRRDIQKIFLWASRLWVGRRNEPILGYGSKGLKKWKFQSLFKNSFSFADEISEFNDANGLAMAIVSIFNPSMQVKTH